MTSVNDVVVRVIGSSIIRSSSYRMFEFSGVRVIGSWSYQEFELLGVRVTRGVGVISRVVGSLKISGVRVIRDSCY